MRFTLEEKDYLYLIDVLERASHDMELRELGAKLKHQVEIDENKNKSKKRRAMKQATEARVTAVKDKMQNAINILRMENKPITVASVARVAEVSYNTANKYRSEIERQA